MSHPIGPVEHPLMRVLAEVSTLLDSVADSQPHFLSTGEKEQILVTADKVRAQVEALQHRILAVGSDVAEAHASRSAGAWLAHATRQDPAAGRRAQKLADGLERWPHLADAYTAGAVSTEQVRVIGRAVDDLPADLDPDLRTRAEDHLVAQAATFGPRDLRVLGRKVLAVVAPDVADAHEAKLLEREEAAAYDDATLHTWRSRPGMTTIQASVPDASADRLMTVLHAFTSPRRRLGAAAPDDRRLYATRLAHAFMTLLERIPIDWVPQHGSCSTQVIVTIDAADLDKQLATAGLTTGTPITAGEARRLACGAGILPAVLDGRSQPLDLGRTKRFYSGTQHKAMTIRDHHCLAEGCTIPAPWCEAHHFQPWTHGGHTDLADGGLLCNLHHHHIHDPRYTTTRTPNGRIRFHRRT